MGDTSWLLLLASSVDNILEVLIIYIYLIFIVKTLHTYQFGLWVENFRTLCVYQATSVFISKLPTNKETKEQ